MKLEYQFSENQTKRISAWQSKLPMFTGNLNGRFAYTIQPTDVGTVVKVRDVVSKEEIDVSEIPAR